MEEKSKLYYNALGIATKLGESKPNELNSLFLTGTLFVKCPKVNKFVNLNVTLHKI